MSDEVSPRRRGRLTRDDEPPANEDFLFHISRGGELLVQNRVIEAKEELEKALSYQPQDVQSQDLLAGVYFRLGVYPTAIRIWSRLVSEFPDDVVLRVNLGLALFKTGQPDQAREQLEHALMLDPQHARAWGYLGLTLWRLGKLDAARDAFLRGGQASMARRMQEESMSAAPPTEEPPEPVPDRAVSDMRDAANEAAQRLSASAVLLSVEQERPEPPSGQWKVVETGAEIARPRPRPILGIAPPSLTVMADGWAVELPEDTPLAVGPEGELVVSSKAPIHSRLSGLRAVRGPLRCSTVYRHFGKAHPHQVLGGPSDPIQRWQAPIAALLAAPEGMRYHALRIAGSQLYVREELVQAFDDDVQYESGRLPLAGQPVVLLSFQGEGTVVLRLLRRPCGLEVRAEDEVHVDPSGLVGWMGRLLPSAVADPKPSSAALAFRGEGIVLVT
jgi:hypothetical protein